MLQVQEQENWASLRLYMAEVNFHAVHAGMAAEAEALRRSLAVEARKGQREAESKAALEQELQAVAGAKERAVTELTQQNAELNDILRAQIESGQQHVQKVQRQYLEDIWELQQSMERDRTLLLGVRDRETALQQVAARRHLCGGGGRGDGVVAGVCTSRCGGECRRVEKFARFSVGGCGDDL